MTVSKTIFILVIAAVLLIAESGFASKNQFSSDEFRQGEFMQFYYSYIESARDSDCCSNIKNKQNPDSDSRHTAMNFFKKADSAVSFISLGAFDPAAKIISDMVGQARQINSHDCFLISAALDLQLNLVAENHRPAANLPTEIADKLDKTLCAFPKSLAALSLSLYYENRGNTALALNYRKKYINNLYDVINLSLQHRINNLASRIERDNLHYAGKFRKLKVDWSELKNSESYYYKLFALITAVFIVSLSVFAFFRYRRKNKFKLIIEEKNKDILDSIRYAKSIQSSIWPSSQKLSQLFPEHFIIFQPMEIVSGDFHWLLEYKNKIYIAVVDSTGHGVPGSFIAMIGYTLLNQIISEENITKPSEILAGIHRKLFFALKQYNRESSTDDYIKISLCSVDYENQIIEFAGASHPLIIYKDSAVIAIDGDNHFIGSRDEEKNCSFTNHKIQFGNSTIIYLATDGFSDEEDRGKSHTEHFEVKDLILKNISQPFKNQQQLIINDLIANNYPKLQSDDLTIAAIKIN